VRLLPISGDVAQEAPNFPPPTLRKSRRCQRGHAAHVLATGRLLAPLSCQQAELGGGFGIGAGTGHWQFRPRVDFCPWNAVSAQIECAELVAIEVSEVRHVELGRAFAGRTLVSAPKRQGFCVESVHLRSAIKTEGRH